MGTGRKIFVSAFCSCFLLIFLGGCQMKKQVDVSTRTAGHDENTAEEMVAVENSQGDLNKIVGKFLGMTLEEAVKNGAEYKTLYGADSVSYEKGNISFSYAGKSREGLGPLVAYKDQYEMAGEQYEEAVSIISRRHDENIIDWGLREVLPDENLDSCKKEEALQYCNSYAEVLGYDSGNFEVEVYALTLDKLMDDSYLPCYPPLEGIDNTEPLSSDELRNIQGDYTWSREYEAMYLVYKPSINGHLLDSNYCILEMVYVPKYGAVVYALGQIPWTVKETYPSGPLISKEDAVAETMLLNHITEEDGITVDNVFLVYSQDILQLREKKELDLCWRVDFKIENSNRYPGADAYQSILINAVTGEKCVMWPGLDD